MEHLDELVINMVLLTLMVIVTFGVMWAKNLFTVVILGGIYSFLIASVFVVLDAVDVAMTEASVGAGIATVLMLATLSMTKVEQSPPINRLIIPIFVAVVTAGALIYASSDLPAFGLANTPVHTHVGPYYLSQSINDTTVPNVVTSVLAAYRSYDTMGEVAVVFTAGIGVMLLLKGRRKKQDKEGQDT